MDARVPTDDAVERVKREIETSSLEVKDEMLTELLTRTHPLRVSQDN